MQQQEAMQRQNPYNRFLPYASAADEFALTRWAAHGYQTDPAALGDTGSWTQLNQRDLADVPQPVLPDGFRFRTADEAGPAAAVRKWARGVWGTST